MKNEKYPNGYLPKVAYHVAQGNEERAISFAKSHVEKYGLIDAEGMITLVKLVEENRLRQQILLEEFHSHL
jgi:hypothetical protein